MTRKQFLELPVRAWNETKDYSAIIVVPTGRKHDSGFALMALVGCDEKGVPSEIAAYCDDIQWITKVTVYGFRCDMFYKNRCLRFHSNEFKFRVGRSLSTTEVGFVKINGISEISEYCREHPEWRFAKASYEMARDAYYGIGFFEDEYVIDVELESELDNICAFEEYEMRAVSLLDFHDAMSQYGIVELLGEYGVVLVMKMIEGIELYAENFPGKITLLLGNVHRILDMIAPDRATAVKASESNEPVRDYMHLQLLFLLGTRILFEKSLKTSTCGTDSIRYIISKLNNMLRKKMLQFSITAWTDEGKKQLAPLCRYMMSTDVGRELQYDIFSGRGLQKDINKTLSENNH